MGEGFRRSDELLLEGLRHVLEPKDSAQRVEGIFRDLDIMWIVLWYRDEDDFEQL